MSFQTDNPVIYILVACAVLMLATIPVTAIICGYRIARGKPLSWGTMLAGAGAIPLLYAVVGSCLDPGYLFEGKGGAIVLLLLAVAASVPPAWAVLAYYRKMGKSDEQPTG